MNNNPKIALVHEYLIRFGGAEQVLRSLANIFPDSPIYTLLHDPKRMGEYFKDKEIHTSFLQSFPKVLRKRHKYLLPFLPTAPETFDLRDFDIVLSSSSAFAKGVITKPKTIHVCYCHAPMTFAHDYYHMYIEEQNRSWPIRKATRLLMHYVRMWDSVSSDRVDHFIANSKITQDRIKKNYNRDSVVIYPPVDVDSIIPQKEHRSYFLIVSQLTPYKRIDIAVQAFNKLRLPLIIIGEGPQRKQLEKMAQSNIKFLGFLPEEKIQAYYRNARAFIFPGQDDFGITAVEAMAAGKPVLAYKGGGTLETVVEGITGEFFNELNPEILADGIRRLSANEKNYDMSAIRKHSEKFSRPRFEKEIKEFIDGIIKNN